MASFSGILKKMFGSKAERDLKQLQPILNKVLESYQRIDKLTDDQLREESGKIRQTIADRIRDNETQKKSLRMQLEDINISAEEKEKLATEVDRLVKKIDEQIEEVLRKIPLFGCGRPISTGI